MRKNNKGDALPMLVDNHIELGQGDDAASVAKPPAALPMFVGQELELYFFLIASLKVRNHSDFLVMRFRYKDYTADLALHDEPCIQTKQAQVREQRCAELVETTAPSLAQRGVANEALQLVVHAIYRLLFKPDEKIFSYQLFAERLRREILKDPHVNDMVMRLRVADVRALLTNRASCRAQLAWLKAKNDFIVHVQWTFSFQQMWGLPVNEVFLQQLKHMVFLHNPDDHHGHHQFDQIIEQALRLDWCRIPNNEDRRFLFWYYVHLRVLDGLKQRCALQGNLPSDRVRIGRAEVNRDNLTVLDLCAFNFRFSKKRKMFGVPMSFWRAQLQKVTDISGLGMFEHDCNKFLHCLGVEVRNTYQGGAEDIVGLEKVLLANCQAAQALVDSAKISIVNLMPQQSRSLLPGSVGPTLFARKRAGSSPGRVTDSEYAISKVVIGPGSVLTH